MLRYQSRFCVPYVDDLRQRIMEEPHGAWHYIHPSDTKMYCDLREIFWLNGMKRDVARTKYLVVHCKSLVSPLGSG